MHCKAFGHIENFDMHSLKQVYIYVMSVALYDLDRVLSCVDLDFWKPQFPAISFTLENLIQNLNG